MATIKELVAKEKERPDIASCRVVHLHKEGQFLGAYEWSAWLLTRSESLRVMHKKFKDIEQTVASIGFPASSLDKFRPANSELVELENGDIDLLLSANDFPDGYDKGLMEKEFENWKSLLPPPEKKNNSAKKEKREDVAAPLEDSEILSVGSLTDIMKIVLRFDVSSHSPIDCQQFVLRLQHGLHHLL